MNTGVYKITNRINGKFYIGSASGRGGFSSRWSRLRYNSYLTASFKKYGIENFTFDILECCEPSACITREQYYLDLLQPWAESNMGYNLCKFAGNTLGLKHSNETKRKMSLAHVGRVYRPRSEEARRKTSIAQKGVPRGPMSEETRRKMSRAKRPPRSPEHRRKISERQLGKKRGSPSLETRAKMSLARKGRKHTIEHSQKIANALRGRVISDETRAKISKSHKLRNAAKRGLK